MRCASGSREATRLLPKRNEIPMLNESASECAATTSGIVGCVAGARHAASCASRAQSLQGGGTAASLSLPKPSRYIYSNTTAPSVAAAECTLPI
jgi:hypothetical protein